jgi:ComEC/Rec2-related protein
MIFSSTILTLGPSICLRSLPTGPYLAMDSALICGIDLPQSDIRQALLDTGLIHLMVVSGSHLAFLEVLLKPFPRLRRVQIPLLCVYCWLVGLQAPVVRALVRRILSKTPLARFNLTPLQIEAATTVVTLMLYPPWLLSRSFLMSWMCGLALTAPSLHWRWKHLELAVKAYVFLLPFCWASPLSILWNTLLAPVVGGVLFPARLLSCLWPWTSRLTDCLWFAVNYVIQNGPQVPQLPLFIGSSHLVLLPLSTHIGLLFMEVKWRRAWAFS